MYTKIKNTKELNEYWYFTIGEYEIPMSPVQQPWCEWEKEIGPFLTKEEAETEKRKAEKKMNGDRQFVTFVRHCNVEKDNLKEKLKNAQCEIIRIKRMKEYCIEYINGSKEKINNLEKKIKEIEDQLAKLA